MFAQAYDRSVRLHWKKATTRNLPGFKLGEAAACLDYSLLTSLERAYGGDSHSSGVEPERSSVAVAGYGASTSGAMAVYSPSAAAASVSNFNQPTWTQPTWTQPVNTAATWTKPAIDFSTILCHACGQYGHFKNQCPNVVGKGAQQLANNVANAFKGNDKNNKGAGKIGKPFQPLKGQAAIKGPQQHVQGKFGKGGGKVKGKH